MSEAIRDFNHYSVAEFKKYIASLKLKREINHIQVHHTWRPTLNGYNLSKDKEQVIRSMWTYHTKACGWVDIAQHFSFVPGGAWDGRSLEKTPCGIANRNSGGICVEIIGDFDKGREVLDGQYRKDVVMMFAILSEAFPKAKFVFHNEFSEKTCPGTSLIKEDFLKEINEARKSLRKVSEPTAIDAVIALNKKKVIGSPDYWTQCLRFSKNVEVHNLKSLIAQYYKVKYGKTDTYEAMIRRMGVDGIFNSPKMWYNPPMLVQIQYIEIILKRMASQL